MGYPAFNLTTIQLPAPSSSMTKAEYKSAYGIDLDAVNVKSFKVVIFGNDKYAIDQIKEVEDGYEIYFNGRILSITDTIETSDEIYDVANSKPIYFHPIQLTTSAMYLAFVILNNDENAYDTKDKLVTEMQAIQASVGDTARFPATGSFTSESVEYVAYSIEMPNQTTIRVYGRSVVDGTASNIQIQALAFNVYDGVNKIN